MNLVNLLSSSPSTNSHILVKYHATTQRYWALCIHNRKHHSSNTPLHPNISSSDPLRSSIISIKLIQNMHFSSYFLPSISYLCKIPAMWRYRGTELFVSPHHNKNENTSHHVIPFHFFLGCKGAKAPYNLTGVLQTSLCRRENHTPFEILKTTLSTLNSLSK